MNKFAERLKELREEKVLSQNQLSKVTGFSSATISNWEANKRIPDIDSIIVLAKFFNVTADYLIGLKNS